jgi:uncharacterized protein YdbL (DUF1318 family)
MAAMKTFLAAGLAGAALLGGAIALNATGTNVASAQTTNAKATVDAAIARGELGEQIDGYIGVVDGANPTAAVRSAMTEINIARKSVYAQLAKQQSVQLNVIATLTGEKQLAKAAPGSFVKDASGRWKRK